MTKKVVKNFPGRIENIFEGIQERRWPRASNSLCTLLVVGSRILSLLLYKEFDHVTDRAGKNYQRLNPSKTRELIVFRRGGHRGSQPPISSIICGAERVDSLRVLGLVITHDLSMTAHLDQELSSCASSTMYIRLTGPSQPRPLSSVAL